MVDLLGVRCMDPQTSENRPFCYVRETLLELHLAELKGKLTECTGCPAAGEAG